jgi:hypothetical protein
MKDFDALREAVATAGGLVTLGDLARGWGISSSRAHQLSHLKDFPAPLTVNGRVALYIRGETDAYRALHPTGLGGQPAHRR